MTSRRRPRPRRPGLRAVLAKAAYRRLFAAQTISRWGDTSNTVALVVLVFRLTGRGLGVTGVVIAEILPVLLLAPAAGVLADRLPRVRLMIAADLWRTALAGLLPMVDHHLLAVYAVAVGLSAGAVLFNPAAAATLPAILDEDELVAGNSGLWSVAVTSQIALAPLAGLLVAAWGVAPAFWFNAATFAASATTLTRLRVTPTGSATASPTTAPTSWGRRLAEGARLVTGDPLLRLLAAVQLAAALSAGATSALLVVLAGRRLGVGPGGFGLLLGAIGIGAATGPLLLARLTSNPRRPGLVFGPLLLRGLVDLTLAWTRSLAVALGALAAYGVGTSTGMVTYNSLLQAEVPARARGRVFAAFDLTWQAGRLASLVLGGIVADRLGVQAVYALGGALLLVAGAGGLAGLPRALASRARNRAPGDDHGWSPSRSA